MEPAPPGLRSLLKQAVTSRHSSLYRALWQHHDEIAAALKKGRPLWDSLAAGFAAHGWLDGEGKPPTAETARHTWYRVRREKAHQHILRHGRPQSVASVPLPVEPDSEPVPVVAPRPAPRSMPLTPDASPASLDPETPPRRFGPAKLRGHDPETSPPPAADAGAGTTPAPAEPPKRDPAAYIDGLLGRGRAGASPATTTPPEGDK